MSTNKAAAKEQVTHTPAATPSPEEQLEALKRQLAERDAQLAEQENIINEQTEALKAAEAQGAGALPVVTYEGKRYKVLARKFIAQGRKVEANTLKTDKDLVKELVESGSGILQEVE